jgi:hypothetical protein
MLILRFVIFLLAGIGLGATAVPAAAANDDFVRFGNSYLVGQLKYLERGLLRFNTSATGTITVEWPEVQELVSKRRLRVELIDGTRYFGFLAKSEDEDMLTVAAGTELLSFPMARVADIEPVEEDFLKRLDIKTSVGVKFTRSTDLLQINLGLQMEYVTDTRISALDFSASSSGETSGESDERLNLDLSTKRLRPRNYLNGYGMTFERSDALGIDMRTSIRATAGRFLTRHPQRALLLEGGLQVTNENYIADESDKQNLEGVATISYDWYSFSNPEFDLKTQLNLYPNLTDLGRWRARLDIGLSWEIWNDLDWTLTFYNDYDSDPQGDAFNNDFGVNTGISWDW